MEFSYNEYYKILFIASLFIFLLVVILLIINSIVFFVKNKQQKERKFVSYILSILVCIFLFSIAYFPMKHGIHLVGEKEGDKIESIGKITGFEKTYGNNKYVYNGENTFAYYILIDGEKYYIMCADELNIGDEVTFEYLPKSRIILSIYVK